MDEALAKAPFSKQERDLVMARWGTLRQYLTGKVSIRNRLKQGMLLVLDIRHGCVSDIRRPAWFRFVPLSRRERADWHA